jgi:hypothetical protein
MVRGYWLLKKLTPGVPYLGGLNSGREAALYFGRLSQEFDWYETVNSKRIERG